MNYQDRLYAKYSSTHTEHLYGEVKKEDLRKYFYLWQSYFGKFLPENKNAEILDVGAGSGALVYWLQASGFRGAEGVDISEEQVEIAKKLGIPNIHKGNLFEFLPARQGKFDAIFARDVVEHFSKESVLEFMDMARAALKDGGVLVLQTLNAENIMWGRLRHGDFTHETAFTRTSMRQALLACGFGRVDIFPQRPIAHGLKSTIRYFLWIFFEFLMRAYLLVETGSPDGIFTQNIIVGARK